MIIIIHFYHNFSSIFIFHIFVNSFSISMNSMEYTTSDTFPHPLITYQCWLIVLTIRFSFEGCLSCYSRCAKKLNWVKFMDFLMHLFQKFLNTSDNKDLSLCMYKSLYSPKLFIPKSFQTLFNPDQ